MASCFGTYEFAFKSFEIFFFYDSFVLLLPHAFLIEIMCTH
jgi:hypothetical protein